LNYYLVGKSKLKDLLFYVNGEEARKDHILKLNDLLVIQYLDEIDFVQDDVKINIARACKCLGDCYNDGTGVKKDKTQAKKWYKKAQGYGFKIKN
jgi:TPR repeat protein